jgi:chemotaxis protein methyltransferase CheR
MRPAPATIQLFLGVVEQKLGLELESHEVRELEKLLLERSSGRRLEPAAYLDRLTQGDNEEWQLLSEKLTIGETYFFRHLEQLNACCALILQLRAKLDGRRPLRLLSAGCSSGEEPYSIAMLLREQGAAEVEIVGLDLNHRSLERARAGRYSEWSLRETPRRTVERWFCRERSEYRLAQTILESVTFIQGNLALPGYPRVGEFDVVLCRNVLMYFSPDQFRRSAARLIAGL